MKHSAQSLILWGKKCLYLLRMKNFLDTFYPQGLLQVGESVGVVREQKENCCNCYLKINVLMKTFETFYLHFIAEIEKLLNAHTKNYFEID